MYLADSKTTEYEKVKEYKETVASWQREQNFDLFGTLLFTFNCNLNREQRQKQYKRFWNEVDKKYTSQMQYRNTTNVLNVLYMKKKAETEIFYTHTFFVRQITRGKS